MSTHNTIQPESLGSKEAENCLSSIDQANEESGVTYEDNCEDSEEEYHSADAGDEKEEVHFESDYNGHSSTCENLDSHGLGQLHSKGSVFPACKSGQADKESTTVKRGDSDSFYDDDTNVSEDENGENYHDSDIRKKLEESLTEKEILEKKMVAQKLKDDGNVKFRSGDYESAQTDYTEALSVCPLVCHKERAIMHSNRAACKLKQEKYESATQDCTKALELHPKYLKALLRRAELYEKVEKLDEALADYQNVLEIDPDNGMAKAACVTLPHQINERNEKMKAEMMGKLKELGNLVLRPFGLSTNNFKMQQDPKTGSYSMQFQQNPPGNGT